MNITSKKLIRRYSDPSLHKEESPLQQRRNGKHDIFVGVGGDDVLTLFKKHDLVGKSRSLCCCNLLAEEGRPLSKGPSTENITGLSPHASPKQSSRSLSVLHVDREQPSSRDGSTSPRLQQRRNGLCYVNSKDLIVKTMKQKKTAADLQKRNANVLLQVSW